MVTSPSLARSTVPETCEGRYVISGNDPLSRTSPCIRRSRAESPLSPLLASTTIKPDAAPVVGSMRNSPLLSRNVPCTVCSVVLSAQRMEVLSGFNVTLTGVVCCACRIEGDTARVDANTLARIRHWMRCTMQKRRLWQGSGYFVRSQNTRFLRSGHIRDNLRRNSLSRGRTIPDCEQVPQEPRRMAQQHRGECSRANVSVQQCAKKV